tara:strand:+ start:1902 stop:2054 length:153 start_codon:yes stop_codon:yes gene_type:complete
MFSYEDFYYSELTFEQLKQHVKSGGLGAYGERCQQEIDKRLQEQNETLKL